MVITKSKIKTFNKKYNGAGLFNSLKFSGCATFKKKKIGKSTDEDYGIQESIASKADQEKFLKKVDNDLVEQYVTYTLMFYVLTQYIFKVVPKYKKEKKGKSKDKKMYAEVQKYVEEDLGLIYENINYKKFLSPEDYSLEPEWKDIRYRFYMNNDRKRELIHRRDSHIRNKIEETFYMENYWYYLIQNKNDSNKKFKYIVQNKKPLGFKKNSEFLKQILEDGIGKGKVFKVKLDIPGVNLTSGSGIALLNFRLDDIININISKNLVKTEANKSPSAPGKSATFKSHCYETYLPLFDRILIIEKCINLCLIRYNEFKDKKIFNSINEDIKKIFIDASCSINKYKDTLGNYLEVYNKLFSPNNKFEKQELINELKDFVKDCQEKENTKVSGTNSVNNIKNGNTKQLVVNGMKISELNEKINLSIKKFIDEKLKNKELDLQENDKLEDICKKISDKNYLGNILNDLYYNLNQYIITNGGMNEEIDGQKIIVDGKLDTLIFSKIIHNKIEKKDWPPKKQRQIFIDSLRIKKKSMFNFSRKDKSPEAVPVVESEVVPEVASEEKNQQETAKVNT